MSGFQFNFFTTSMALATLLLTSAANAAVTVGTGIDASGNTVVFKPDELRQCETVEKRLTTEENNRVYNQAFPAYIEFCAASTWQKRGASDGGNFGHAFGMIHGACVAKDSNGKRLVPQQLVPCRGGTVGFSTESVLFNHQWVAADSREMTLYGNHDPAQPFDVAAWKRVQDLAWNTGTFDGLEVRSWAKTEAANKAKEAGAPADKYFREWLADYTFGTEFALSSARGGVDCTRIPLTGTKRGAETKPLKDVLAYLNQVNQKAYQDSKITPPGATEPVGFDYDGIVNNCAHTVYNALASIGFWPKKNSTGHPAGPSEILKRVSDVVAPYNSMLDAYNLGSRIHLPTLIQRFRTSRADFEYFKATGWLGNQVGTMIDSAPPLSFQNAIYDPTNRTNFASIPGAAQMLAQKAVRSWVSLDIPIYQPLKNQFEAIKSDATGPGVDLVTNLEWWKALYGFAIERLQAREDQDEVVVELTNHFKAKLAQTEDLLGRREELTPKAVAPVCKD